MDGRRANDAAWDRKRRGDGQAASEPLSRALSLFVHLEGANGLLQLADSPAVLDGCECEGRMAVQDRGSGGEFTRGAQVRLVVLAARALDRPDASVG